jgi:hypothetical protein
VEDLVHAATPEREPRHLKRAVQATLDAFGRTPPRARESAVRAIGRALAKTDGRGANVLSLTLGALVERGAPPEVAWPSLGRDLVALLDGATAFVTEAIRASKDDVVESALEAAGAALAHNKPRKAAALAALPSRCLAGVACLTRSKKLRAKVRRGGALVASAWPLSDAIGEVGALVQAIRILDDATILVLAPDAGAGWRFAADGLASNLELYALLADALLGDPKKAPLAGKRIDAKALSAVRGDASPKRPPRVKFPFQLLPWTAVHRDGSLPPPEEASALSFEDMPADIPALRDEQIVLVQAATLSPVPVEPTFASVRPSLRLVEELALGDVLRTMITLAKGPGALVEA